MNSPGPKARDSFYTKKFTSIRKLSRTEYLEDQFEQICRV